MAYEQKEMEGSLFVNDKRQKDTDRSYQGSMTINGQEFWLSGWLNEKKDGGEWIGLKIQPKEATAGQAAVERVKSAFPGAKVVPAGEPADGMDDEIPF